MNTAVNEYNYRLSSQIIPCLTETEPEKLLFIVVFQQNT